MHKVLGICILFFTLITKVSATHLVGGEMNYRYLSEGVYEITLTVYRDCYLGIPDFDEPGFILVYTGGGTFLGAFVINGDPKIKLPVEVKDECFTAPPHVCVERKQYIFNGELPPNSDGYYLSYQRCCRNNSIINEMDDKTSSSGDSGMNLFAFIPSEQKIKDGNPVFNNYPPVAICANQPLIFDHSAVDPDGDSIVYRLCTPTDALSPDNPTVNSFNYDAVPFVDVRWRNPYTLDSLMDSKVKLQINSQTGLITAYPTRIGQYLVGVCADEYRDGKYISQTKRDFQFNVAECGKVSVSSFFTEDTLCNQLEVTFHNNSKGANHFKWFYGDGDTSDAIDGVHVYKDYGAYQVMLVAYGNNGCNDTSIHQILLRKDDFSYHINDVLICKGGNALLQIDAPEGTIRNVNWLFNPPVYTTTPSYTYKPKKSEKIGFDIKANSGCIYHDSVSVKLVNPQKMVINHTPEIIYYPQDVSFSANYIEGYTYLWKSKGANTNPHSPKTTITISESQWVYLTTSDSQSACIQTDSVYMRIDTCDLSDQYEINQEIKTYCDHALISLDVEPHTLGTDYHWLFNGDSIQGQHLTFDMLYDSTYTYALVAKSYCNDTSIYTVKAPALTLKLPPLKPIQLCNKEDSVNVDLGIESDVDYQIRFEDGTLYLNRDSFNVKVIGNDLDIPFTITFNDSCSINDTIRIRRSQISVQASAEPYSVEKGEETTLHAIPGGYVSYQWLPDSLVLNPNESNTTAVIYESTDFIVVAVDENGCQARDTVRVNVVDNPCQSDQLFVPTAFTPNGDGKNDVWKVRTKGEVQIYVAIYNRWGEKVYDSYDINKGWDGTYQGKNAAAGSYAYYLTIICENNHQYFKKGNITLIR